jgi:hypothetical protein
VRFRVGPGCRIFAVVSAASAALRKKLQLGDGARVAVSDPYGVLAVNVQALASERSVSNRPSALTEFYVASATTHAEVARSARAAAALKVADPIVWVTYPKKASKRYTCEFDRDTGWEPLGAVGFEPVRQVAVDDDWSALRFRRVAHIKTMKRSFAMTDAGKKKSSAGVRAKKQ